MKTIQIIAIILSLLFFGCNTRSNNEESRTKEFSENEISHREKEQDQLLVNNNNAKPTNSDKTFLLLDQSVGEFKIGNSIPFPSTSDEYIIEKDTQIRRTEEGSEEEPIYIVFRDGKEILQLKPAYDYTSKQYSKKIGEIIVTSSIVKTPEDVGVGSSIEEFVRKYPEYKFWYSYVSGMYILEAKSLNGQFILSEKDFVGKLTIQSDIVTLKKSDFRPGAQILKVRVI